MAAAAAPSAHLAQMAQMSGLLQQKSGPRLLSATPCSDMGPPVAFKANPYQPQSSDRYCHQQQEPRRAGAHFQHRGAPQSYPAPQPHPHQMHQPFQRLPPPQLQLHPVHQSHIQYPPQQQQQPTPQQQQQKNHQHQQDLEQPHHANRQHRIQHCNSLGAIRNIEVPSSSSNSANGTSCSNSETTSMEGSSAVTDPKDWQPESLAPPPTATLHGANTRNVCGIQIHSLRLSASPSSSQSPQHRGVWDQSPTQKYCVSSPPPTLPNRIFEAPPPTALSPSTTPPAAAAGTDIGAVGVAAVVELPVPRRVGSAARLVSASEAAAVATAATAAARTAKMLAGAAPASSSPQRHASHQFAGGGGAPAHNNNLYELEQSSAPAADPIALAPAGEGPESDQTRDQSSPELAEGMRLEIGGQICQISKPLGMGSFGVVWSARSASKIRRKEEEEEEEEEEDGNDDLAVKEIICKSEVELERAGYEANLLKELTARGAGRVPAFFGCEVDEPQAEVLRMRLAMTKLSGDPLDRQLQEAAAAADAALAAAAAAAGCAEELLLPRALALQVESAFRYAWRLVTQLVPTLRCVSSIAYHRDVNAHNILVSKIQAGSEPEFGLVDFGLAVEVSRWMDPSPENPGGQSEWEFQDVGGDCRYWPTSAWRQFEAGCQELAAEPNLCLEYQTHLDLQGLGITAAQVLAEMLGPVANVLMKYPHLVDPVLWEGIQHYLIAWNDYWGASTQFWSCLLHTFRTGGDWNVLKNEFVELRVHAVISETLVRLRMAAANLQSCCRHLASTEPYGLLSQTAEALLSAMLVMISAGEIRSRQTFWDDVIDHVGSVMEEIPQSAGWAIAATTTTATATAAAAEEAHRVQEVMASGLAATAELSSEEVVALASRSTHDCHDEYDDCSGSANNNNNSNNNNTNNDSNERDEKISETWNSATQEATKPTFIDLTPMSTGQKARHPMASPDLIFRLRLLAHKVSELHSDFEALESADRSRGQFWPRIETPPRQPHQHKQQRRQQPTPQQQHELHSPPDAAAAASLALAEVKNTTTNMATEAEADGDCFEQTQQQQQQQHRPLPFVSDEDYTLSSRPDEMHWPRPIHCCSA